MGAMSKQKKMFFPLVANPPNAYFTTYNNNHLLSDISDTQIIEYTNNNVGHCRAATDKASGFSR